MLILRCTLYKVSSEKELKATYVISETILGEGAFGKVLSIYLDPIGSPDDELLFRIGQVFLGTRMKTSNRDTKHVAIKVISSLHADQIKAEVSALRACRGSEHVVNLRGVYRHGEQSIAIVSELCMRELYDLVLSEVCFELEDHAKFEFSI